MAKYNRNSGKPWKAAEVSKLRELAKGNTPTPSDRIKTWPNT